MSETARYRHIVASYATGNGIDVGCGGELVVPHAIGIDLPDDKLGLYAGCQVQTVAQWRGDGTSLPFKDKVCDFVYSSHLLEDYADWHIPLQEWVRVLKVGGHLVILVPDKKRFAAAIAAGQPPNPWHKHEGTAGELSGYADRLGLKVLEDRLTNLDDKDYSILFVGQRVR